MGIHNSWAYDVPQQVSPSKASTPAFGVCLECVSAHYSVYLMGIASPCKWTIHTLLITPYTGIWQMLCVSVKCALEQCPISCLFDCFSAGSQTYVQLTSAQHYEGRMSVGVTLLSSDGVEACSLARQATKVSCHSTYIVAWGPRQSEGLASSCFDWGVFTWVSFGDVHCMHTLHCKTCNMWWFTEQHCIALQARVRWDGEAI